MVTLNKDDCSGYLISEDEIKYYTIPIFDNKIKFNIVNVTKNLFGIKNKNILFSIDKTPKERHHTRYFSDE